MHVQDSSNCSRDSLSRAEGLLGALWGGLLGHGDGGDAVPGGALGHLLPLLLLPDVLLK